MPDFKHRSEQAEIMDDLNIAGEELDKTLVELDVINRWLGGNGVTFRGLKKLTNTLEKEDVITIADLGCGSGGMLRQIAKWSKKQKLNVLLHGLDANKNVVVFAEKQSTDHPNLKFLALDILKPEFKSHSYDIVMATLFFHHFSKNQLVEIFKNLASIANYGIVVNDLHRHFLAYYGFKCVSSVFSRSRMVKCDGPLSVLRGFKRNEIREILALAGIKNYQLKWRWAFRWELVIWV